MRPRRQFTVLTLMILGLLVPVIAYACPVCFGDPDSNQARGIRAAILVLGGVTGVLVVAIAGVVITIHRRAGRGEP